MQLSSSTTNSKSKNEWNNRFVSAIQFFGFIFFSCQMTLVKAEDNFLSNIWNPYFQSYTADDGLSQSEVLKIIQDDNEFLWFLTSAGVDRFNGFGFEQISFDDSAGLNAQLDIVTLFLNHQKQVSVITRFGSYYIFDPVQVQFVAGFIPVNNQRVNIAKMMANGQVYLFGFLGVTVLDLEAKPVIYKEPINKQLAELINITNVYVDNNQIFWISSKDGQLFSFDPFEKNSSVGLVTHHFLLNDGSPVNHQKGIFVTTYNKQYVIVAFRSGELFRASHDIILGKILPTLNNLQKQPKLISSILQTSSDYFWIGTRNDGLFRVSISSFSARNYRAEVNQPGSLISNNIDGLFLDKQGQLWVNSSNGVNFANINLKRFFQIGGNFAYVPKLPSSFVSPILLGLNNELWTGSSDAGLSLSNFNRKQNSSPLIHFNNPVFITRLGLDSENKIWVGSDRQFQWFDATNHDELPISELWNKASRFGVSAMRIRGGEKLLVDRNNRLSYQNNNEQVFQCIISQNDSDPLISVISNPINQTYWLAGNKNNLLYQFNAKTKTVTKEELFAVNGKAIKGIISLLNLNNRFLWIGTKGQGILRKNLKTGEASWLVANDGLPDNTIYSLLSDNLGNIWITSNKGLSRFSVSTQKIQNFTVADGIQSNEFNGKSAFRSETGLLFFGGINGITVIDENTFTLNQHIPKTYIHSASLFTNDGLKRLTLSQDSLGELDYQSNSLSFKIGAIDLLNPDGIHYSYRLVGQSDQWQALGNNRTINLLQLPAGDYIFEVTSCNSENTCNPIAKTVRFSIAPAPWLSRWAFVVYALILLSVIGYFIKKHKDKLQMQKMLAENEKKISQELRSLNTLKDQFLANTSHELRTPLNGIIGLSEMLQTEPKNISIEESQKSLAAIQECGVQLNDLVNDLLDFSQFHNKRIRLNRTVFSVRPLFEEIMHLLQPMLFEQSLKIEIDMSRLDIMVYADKNRIRQVLYNLLNNAIKFSDKGIIKICIKKIDQNIEVSVVDQGVGIEQSKQKSIFMSFTQVDGSSTRNQGGVGLGLSICKEIIELHGVELMLQSEMAKGSTFSFLLPDRTKYAE